MTREEAIQKRTIIVTQLINELGITIEMNTKPLIYCKDCKHNPKRTNDFAYGRCVCCCEDDWYGYVPDDDFFCGHGERIDGRNE